MWCQAVSCCQIPTQKLIRTNILESPKCSIINPTILGYHLQDHRKTRKTSTIASRIFRYLTLPPLPLWTDAADASLPVPGQQPCCSSSSTCPKQRRHRKTHNKRRGGGEEKQTASDSPLVACRPHCSALSMRGNPSTSSPPAIANPKFSSYPAEAY